jgi:hypothetical protein
MNLAIAQLTDALRGATDQAGRLQALRDYGAAPKQLRRHEKTNSEFYAEIDASEGRKRKSLTELRHRHLEKIDRIARRADYDRADYQEYLVENYDRLFGALRGSKAKEVPADQFRKWWMVGLLLDRVDARRSYFKSRGFSFTKF